MTNPRPKILCPYEAGIGGYWAYYHSRHYIVSGYGWENYVVCKWSSSFIDDHNRIFTVVAGHYGIYLPCCSNSLEDAKTKLVSASHHLYISS